MFFIDFSAAVFWDFFSLFAVLVLCCFVGFRVVFLCVPVSAVIGLEFRQFGVAVAFGCFVFCPHFCPLWRALIFSGLRRRCSTWRGRRTCRQSAMFFSGSLRLFCFLPPFLPALAGIDF